MKRIVLVVIGLISVGLAIIGIWTPGLPTTPFLIVALWAFAGSSPRLYKWLSNAPVFKTAMVHVKEFDQHKTVNKKVKLVSQGCAWGSFLFMFFKFGLGNIVTVIVFLAAVSCSVAMSKIATTPA